MIEANPSQPFPSEPKYEEQFTAIIDLLGFSEASTRTDAATRLSVLQLLQSLSGLRGEFNIKSFPAGAGKRTHIKPAVSTFSDHIVVSYPIQPIANEIGHGDMSAMIIVTEATHLLARIAAAALRIGFLIRGGATIGNLYHAGGVVFGEALVDAYEIESRTSIYPRVVLSSAITNRPWWDELKPHVQMCNDGLCHLDYFRWLLVSAAVSSNIQGGTVKAWFDDATATVARNMAELRASGKLNQFAKWAWFACEFRRGIEALDQTWLASIGISLNEISWP